MFLHSSAPLRGNALALHGRPQLNMRRLANNAFWSLIGHLLFRGSLMVATIFLARHLDTRAFATYSYFQLTIAMLATFGELGMGVTASRLFAEIGHESKVRDPSPIGTLWCLSLVVSVALAGIVLMIPVSWLSAGLPVPRWLLAMGVFVLAVGIVPGGAVLGLEQYRQSAVVSALGGLSMLAGATWAALQSSATIGMVTLVIAFLVKSGGDALLVLRSVGVSRLFGRWRLHRKEMRRVLGFGGPMFAVTLMSGSGAWLLGRMILGGPGGEHAFALYSIGMQWFALALLVPGMISRVTLPRLVRTDLSSEGGAADSRTLVRRGAVMTVLSGVAVAAGGVAAGPWLLWMYGANFDAGRWFIAAFMLAAVLGAPANLIGNAIIARDGQWRWLLLTLVWLAALLAAGRFSVSVGAWAGAVSQGFAAAVVSTLALLTAFKRRLI